MCVYTCMCIHVLSLIALAKPIIHRTQKRAAIDFCERMFSAVTLCFLSLSIFNFWVSPVFLVCVCISSVVWDDDILFFSWIQTYTAFGFWERMFPALTFCLLLFSSPLYVFGGFASFLCLCMRIIRGVAWFFFWGWGINSMQPSIFQVYFVGLFCRSLLRYRRFLMF